MKQIAAWFVPLAWGVLLLTGGSPLSLAASELYAPQKPDEVRAQIFASFNDQKLTEETRQKIEALWTDVGQSTPPDRLLELVIQSLALADADVMNLVRECNSPSSGVLVSHTAILNQSTRSPFFRANIGQYYGRCLVERRLYDEAWDILKSIDVRHAVDPASLFFFQAVAAQGMLELKPALEALDRLLTDTERVPVRYSAVAVLMQADLKGVEAKSLGEIAKLMADSERRLELGRAGERVQGVQERIVSTLDELIKKFEQQQNGGGGGGGSEQGGNSNSPSDGAQDSNVKGAEAPGETDKRHFDHKGNWGNLPEKDVAKAKTDLNKNFPSHYEQAIEKYTKKLATRKAKQK